MAITSLIAANLHNLRACTIFVLTDSRHALFCNNEDYSNPKTRIWFIPGNGHYGCVYVGFDNGWAQGGLNTKGLAFDWVAGYKESWEPDPAMKAVPGNPSQRMLESCATVPEAIQFYHTHRERSFSYAKILVADRSGASVIIGAKDGIMQFDKLDQTRGFGFGGETLDKLLADSPAPSPANGSRILRACLQSGQYATKYSNIYDLNSGDIFLFPTPSQQDSVKLNLFAELAKGAHYFDMPQIREQQSQPLKPLEENMKGTPLERYKPIPDHEPKVAQRIRRILQDALDGKMQAQDYSPATWQDLMPKQADIQTQLNSLGPVPSPTLVARSTDGGKRDYRYRLEFQKTTLLMHFIFDDQDKVTLCDVEASE
jgi:hypothetical protein